MLGESPLVDVTSSATDNSLSQDLLFNFPIRYGNVATALLNSLPGINSQSAYGGDASSGNALLIDGVDTRDPSGGTAWTFYNFNIVEEVQAVGIGAPAEFGAFSGAVINTVTKSGGNRYSGLFDVTYTNERPGGRQHQRRDHRRRTRRSATPPRPTSCSTSRPSSAGRSSRTSCSSSRAPSATT